MKEEILNKETVYDQKTFIQLRLHELFVKIDAANTNPFFFNHPLPGVPPSLYGLYNYQIAFNNLCSVLQTIHAKINKKEREEAEKQKTHLMSIVNVSFETKIKDPTGQRGIASNVGMKNNLMNKICKFRYLLEDYMSRHGFNPDKDDVGKAIIKM